MKKLLLVTAALITLSIILTGTLAYASDIDRRISEIQTKISQGVNSGQLTQQGAQELKNELNGIRRDEAKMRAEVLRLNRELDRISKNIHDEKTDKDNVVSDIGRRISEMQTRINQGVNSGQLTQQEAQMLNNELNGMMHDAAGTRAEAKRLNTILEGIDGNL